MKFSSKVLSAAVLMASSSIALAASDSTEIEINVTKDAYVNLTGSLAGNVVSTLSEADVDGTTTVLGTLGTESNTVGGCEIEIGSQNDFKLKHNESQTALYLHGANNFTINYLDVDFTSGGTSTVEKPCNNAFADSPLSITSPAIVGVVQAGTYSDTLTVTVTTQ